MDERLAKQIIESLSNRVVRHGITVNLSFDTTSNSIKGTLNISARANIPIQVYKSEDGGEVVVKSIEQSTANLPITSLSDFNTVLLLYGTNLLATLPEQLVNSRNISLANLIIKFAPDMENLIFSSLQFEVKEWSIYIGALELKVVAFTIEFKWENGQFSGKFQGRTNLHHSSETELQGDLQNGFNLLGHMGSIELNDLLNNWGVNLRFPVGFPKLMLPQVQFRIQFVASSPTVFLYSQVDGLGQITVVVQKQNESWETFVIVSLLADWKLSDLSGYLQPLNILEIKMSSLTVATNAKPEFSYMRSDGTIQTLQIQKDLNLFAELFLRGAGLEFVATLIGREVLPLQLQTSQNLTDTKISAGLNQKLNILPDIITLDQFALNITPQPLSIRISCEATITIFGTELPKFRANAAIEQGKTELSLETIEPWKNVFGINGFAINKTFFEMETAPVPKYGIYGDISISDKTIRMATQFIGNAPSMIAGSLQGVLSLNETVRDLVGLQLPDFLDLSIKDFNIYAVVDPQGVTIGDVHFDPGFALQGTLGILGLDLFTKIVVDPNNGIFAQGSLSQLISIGDVLKISDAAGSGPPVIVLDTRTPNQGTVAPPLLRLSGLFDLMGLRDTIEVNINRSGFDVTFEKQLGVVEYKWRCRVRQPNFFGESTFKFGLNFSTGPITVSGQNLGSIKINTGFEGTTLVSFQDDRFKMSIDGSFEVQGLKFHLPSIHFSARPDSLERLPGLIEQNIKDNASELFQDMLADPLKWLQGIKEGLIEGVENVAGVLKEKFNRTAEQIGADIRNTLELGSDAAAEGLKSIGEDVEKIASILKGLGEPADKVRSALTKAGFSSENVRGTIQKVFNEIPHLDVIEILHCDIPLTPHGDTPFTPHVDTPLTPHGDVKARAHIDVASVGHIDFLRGHIDSGGFIHGDFRGFHGDTAATPHLDVPLKAHIDVKSAGHGDIAAVGHLDIPAVGHCDIQPVPHGDSS